MEGLIHVGVHIEFLNSIPNMLSHWGALYPHPLTSKSWFKVGWMTLLEFILWKIGWKGMPEYFKKNIPLLHKW